MRKKSKLVDIHHMNRSHALRGHVPLTRPFSEKWLHQMLTHSNMLYVKPDNSLKGYGILRITVKNRNEYTLQAQDTQKTSHHTTFSSLWKTINRWKRKQTYIIQQGITSVTPAGNPFDVRVHLLRVNNQWLVAGMMGRVAKHESIVTNGSAGARRIPIDILLKNNLGLTPEKALQYSLHLKTVAIAAALSLRTKNPGWYEYGVDLGIDSSGRAWVYEINSSPGPILFQYDKPSYNRIYRLRKYAS